MIGATAVPLWSLMYIHFLPCFSCFQSCWPSFLSDVLTRLLLPSRLSILKSHSLAGSLAHLLSRAPSEILEEIKTRLLAHLTSACPVERVAKEKQLVHAVARLLARSLALSLTLEFAHYLARPLPRSDAITQAWKSKQSVSDVLVDWLPPR